MGASLALFPIPISLPRMGERVGLRNVLFEDCSAFTHVTACTLAKSPKCDLLHQRLQPFRYLHDCSDCFRLEQQLPDGSSHPLRNAAFPRRTPFTDLPFAD